GTLGEATRCSKLQSGLLLEIEQTLLARVPPDRAPRPVFIVAAPRTGSTFLYQLVVQCMELCYISNLTDACFSSRPIVGIALQTAVAVEIATLSRFGKTEGALQPSEGSAVMTHWFGGGHPSQTMSSRILPDKEGHFIATLSAAESLNRTRPLVIKNAWNCFRLDYLMRSFPDGLFIWVRRDILDAAESDLEARYLTKGSAHGWNSATPSNIEELRRLSPAQQVVENQYEFNRAIGTAILRYPSVRAMVVWYESLLRSPETELKRIGDALGLQSKEPSGRAIRSKDQRHRVTPEERSEIRCHVDAHRSRLSECCYRA
ncbi:MAG: sulfotransferase family protein, partial [Gammaproteobacteria bacterium]